jgi:hypothetical protein
MTKDGNELKWLRNDEWQWAQQYMDEHADPAMHAAALHFAPKMAFDYAQTVNYIAYFEQTVEGLKFVTRLKNALRQHRYRAPSHGRKLCTFTLPNSTKGNLSRIAKDHSLTETQVITVLIDDADQLAKKHSEQEKKLRASKNAERNRSLLATGALKAQLDATMKHLERTTELVVMWQQSTRTEQPPASGNSGSVKQEVEKQMKLVKERNALIGSSHGVPYDE